MRTRRTLSVLSLVVAAALAVAACSGSSSPTNAVAGSTAAAGASAGAVTIADFSFTPQTLTVKPGTKVTWTNTGVTHTVTSDDGKTFDSGDITSGSTFSFTFSQAGTFAYHCNIHHSMTAKVIVAP